MMGCLYPAMPARKGLSDDDVIEAVRETQPAGTADIADILGVQRQAADYRLRNLRDESKVQSQKIGGSLVWTLPDE